MSDKEEDVDTNANKNEVNDIDHLSRDQLPISSSSSNFTSSASIDTHDCNFIERITPKVLFVGSSLKVGPNQFIQKDLPVFMRQELGMVPPPGVKNKGMKLEQTGLDKFRKYIESNRTYPEMKLGERVSRQLSGQEKIANVSVTIGCLKNEQKKMTSRPPVLGHASSSSNDSGSVISGSSGNESEDVPVSVSAVGTDNEFVYTDVKLAVLSNREDYISVKPPEGSSDQSSLSLQQEQPPSSASSVASVSLKPLEWDSGADVGYYQIYSSNNNDDKKLSTIERIAIATGSAALLTRLEPEGTAEYLSQLANTIPSNKSLKKGNIKDRLGLPIAESTPFSTNQLNADTPLGLHATSGSEDELSPITAAASSEHLCAQTAINEDAYHELNELARQMPSYEKLPRPLFPDIKPRNPSPSAGSSQSSQKNKPISSYFTPLQEDIDKVPENSEQQENLDTESINTGALKGNLRKHCSMENLRDNELPISPPTINLFNTLPRSHSHSNVCVALPESNTLPKYLLQSHNPTKSASSSSISTVVQKRKDSPKHISKLVQTSFVNQSIGVQATESSRSSQKSRSQSRERSQSLKAESNPLSGPSSITGFSIQNFQCSKPSLVSPLHRHNGNVCTGAHRKVFDRGEVSKRHTSRSNYARTSKDESNVGSNSSDQQKGGKVNMADGKESRIDNNDESGTLDSVTSSARTDHHAWADRRESIGVEDRANSFEYLPGHMYETVARPDDASGESSSISLNRNASSQNEVSDEAEKSWDLSNSSTLARDIERGVDMMLNFVQSSQVKSSELKKKLIKRVAEKLISNDIASGGHKLDSKNQSSVGSHSLSEDGLGEHINGRETRRSLVKDIPCQESPFTSERTSSRTSSECFKPKSSFSSANKFMKDAHDKCVGTEFTTQSQSDSNEPRRTVGSVGVQCESISSNEVSKLYLEKSSGKYHDKKESRDLKKQQTVNGEKKRQAALERRFKTTESSATIDSNRSSSVDHSTDWRPAMPIPTNVFEQKRKHQGNARRAMSDNGNSKAMIDLLSVERDNQRIMIQSEIEHLDYLRRLLRKQEELRDSLARIQKTRKKHLESRYNRCKTANESNKQMLNSIKSRLEQYSKSHHKRNSYTIEEHQEWDSHHYYSSTDEMNKPVSKKVHGSNSISRNQQPGENNDPVANKLEDSGRVNNSHPSKERENRTAVKSNDEVIESDEIPATDGNQQPVVSQPRKSSKSSISGQSGPEKAVCNCKKKQSCKCFRNNQSLEKNKKPLAYFITFEDGSSGNNSNVGTDTSMEEVKMKSNKSHDKSSTGTNLKKKELTIEKENREPKHFRKQNECRPTLQEYLLMNRGEYVNRAEYRRKCVAELTYLRELRNKTKRHLIVMAPESSDYSQSTTPRELPPPPLAMKRVFSQKTMRRQTERKYRKLAEVQNRHIDMKRKEAYRTNRLMAEVFTKKLQKRVLNGETNLSNSVSVISSL